MRTFIKGLGMLLGLGSAITGTSAALKQKPLVVNDYYATFVRGDDIPLDRELVGTVCFRILSPYGNDNCWANKILIPAGSKTGSEILMLKREQIDQAKTFVWFVQPINRTHTSRCDSGRIEFTAVDAYHLTLQINQKSSSSFYTCQRLN